MYYGDLVCLRALEMTDLEDIMLFQNDWNLQRWAGVPLPQSRLSLENWLKNASIAHPLNDGTIYFAVTDKKSGEFIGITRLYNIKNPHHRASVGIAIHNPSNRSKGYGPDTTKVVLWVAFNVLGLHSAYLDTMEHNEHAIHVAEKVGFKRIGMFRETEFIDGEYKGLIYYDILKCEFEELYSDMDVSASSSDGITKD